MPQVKVSREIEGEKKKVYAAVKKYLDGRDTMKKLGASIDWDDKGCSGQIEAAQFSGSLSVEADAKKSTVQIVVDLPLLLTPFKGKVEEELKKHLSRVEV
jgi:hypothetical protein